MSRPQALNTENSSGVEAVATVSTPTTVSTLTVSTPTFSKATDLAEETILHQAEAHSTPTVDPAIITSKMSNGLGLDENTVKFI